MKFKIGDEVIIKDIKKYTVRNNCEFNSWMSHYIGEKSTITNITRDGCIILDRDKGKWFWAEDFLTNTEDFLTNTHEIYEYQEALYRIAEALCVDKDNICDFEDLALMQELIDKLYDN